MKSYIFGYTFSGLPMTAYHFGSSGNSALIIGGVHGDEYEGVIASLFLLKAFSSSFPYKLNLTLIPLFNVDGILKKQRKNANNVDLNRNLPTNDWSPHVAKEKYFPGLKANSEPENQALVQWLEKNKPKLIISLHSWENALLNTNGDCHPEVEILSQKTGYKITEFIGYPTPGSLGTYSGLERKIPTITYEFKKNLPTNKILQVHVPAIQEALKATEKRI